MLPLDGPESAASLVDAWRADPVRFVADTYTDLKPDADQASILEAVRDYDRVAVRTGRGVGKTANAAGMVIPWFLATHYPALVVTAAGTWNHLSDKLWPEIRQWGRQWRLREWWEYQDLGMYHRADPDGWRVVAASSDKAENVEGYHSPNLLLLIDEGKGMPDEIFAALLASLTGTGDAALGAAGVQKVVAYSTPPLTKGGWFTRVSTSSDWKLVHVSGLDSPRVSRTYIEEIRKDYGEESPQYQSYVLGNIPEGAAEAVVQARWAEAAQALGPRQDRRPPVITCDVAREGEDLTTIGVIENARFGLVHFDDGRWGWFSGADLMQTAGRCVAAVKQHGARMAVVDDSVTGDVPVIVRKQGRWVDIVPIASLHKRDSTLYSKHNGLEILSGTGWTKIIHSRRHRVTKELFDVVTVDGRTKVTQDHSLVVGGRETKPADLTNGTVIDTYRPCVEHYEDDGITTDLAWTLGLFLAEGSITRSEKHKVTIARIANTDMGLLLRAESSLESMFCQSCSVHSNGDKGEYQTVYALRLGDAATDFVSRFCYTTVQLRTSLRGEHHTKTLRFKKVPIQVLNGSRAIREAFIDGYMAGDGLITKTEYKSDSKDLALVAGLQYLQESLGYTTRVRIRNDKLNITTLARVQRGEGVTGEVKRVRSLGYTTEYVYDLETASHTFVAGAGFLVHHNTGLGGGVTDRLRELQAQGVFPKNCSIVGCKFGGSPRRDDRFHNLKDELWWETREALRKGLIALPSDEEIQAWQTPRGSDFKAQIISPIYEYDSSDRIDVLDKRKGGREKTRALPIKSPDLAHALILGVSYYLRQPVQVGVQEPPKDGSEALWRVVQAQAARAAKPPVVNPYRRAR